MHFPFKILNETENVLALQINILLYAVIIYVPIYTYVFTNISIEKRFFISILMVVNFFKSFAMHNGKLLNKKHSIVQIQVFNEIFKRTLNHPFFRGSV